MAWFECTTGASSGNGVALIVTTDASFAGSNITASNGVDTFTQQCPSSAPYVVTFEDIPTGTYTISGVTGGQTVTKTYVVSDYNFEFHNTPTGSTATPVNVIQTWLHCANIWNKTYTTINQVLADTSTLLALISSNNAADYMARSTNWASSVCANQTAMGYIGNNNYCANKLLADSTWRTAICNSTYFESVLNVKVPTMTSDTTPSGEVFATSVHDYRYPAYKAFNADATGWLPTSNTISNKLGYRFLQSIKVYKVTIKRLTSTTYTPSYNIKGSNDGNTWSNSLGSFSGEKNGNQIYSIIINPSESYSRYAIDGTAGAASADEGFKVQFYGRA